ncbi:MAG TPA: hypothetical protein VIH59_14890 [Candidatus Tectomicrobia bacterium]|jgi:hypothetical protein
MADETVEKIRQQLEQDYLLKPLKKSNLAGTIGGVIAFLAVTGFTAWSAAKLAIESGVAAIATQDIRRMQGEAARHLNDIKKAKEQLESLSPTYTTLDRVKDWIGLQAVDGNSTDDGFEGCNQNDPKACARMAIAACGRIGYKVGFINGQRHPSGPIGVICIGK